MDADGVSPETRRLLDETLLGEALAHYHEAAGHAIVVTDEVGAILAVNDAFCRLLGYRRDELIGTSVQEVSGRESLDEVDELYEALRRRASVSGVAVLRRKDGAVGRIRYEGLSTRIGALPVIVSITEAIASFELQP